MFLPELTLSFDDTIKHVLIAGGAPLSENLRVIRSFET
jgi:hypothetical protein